MKTSLPRPRALLVPLLLALAAGAAGLGAAALPAAPVPGYRLVAEWPAAAHGLPAPLNLTTGADGRVWLVDGPFGEAVALTADGSVSERRPVPSDTLDLAVGPDDNLYLGRWTGRPPAGQAMHNVGRYDASGQPTWTARCECATGSGVAAVEGRVWLTDPERNALRWLGSSDGRVSGEIDARGASPGFPADVDASPDGTLFAADLSGRAVYAWPKPYLPGDYETWTMLEAAGPLRVGASTQPDGEILVAVLFSDGLVRVHRPDGTLVARFFAEGEPADIAVGAGGRLYLLDQRSHALRVYEPGPPPTATPVPPDPPIVPSSCTISGSRTLSTSALERCDEVEVLLSVSADCPPDALTGADVALVIDRSLSMIQDGKMDAAKAAARRFLAGLDLDHHQASVVSFSVDATVDQGLTEDRAGIEDAIDALRPSGSGTNIQEALLVATRHLLEEGRGDALPVIVMLTDGKPTLPVVPEPATAALAAAERARSRRGYIVTIGLGRFIDSLLLEGIASAPEDFYYAPSAVDLDKIYDTILRVVQSIGVTDVVIEDVPDPGFLRFVPGSGQPPPLVVNDALQWTRPVLPGEGITLTYRAQAIAAGRRPIGPARMRYTDADGTRRTYAFPEPVLDAAYVTPTPDPARPSPTPDPAVTSVPTLPPAPQEPSCPPGSDWRLALSVFPDVVGYGPYACPGCNGRFDGGDHWDVGATREPAVVIVRDESGRVLWLREIELPADGPGRALARLCSPPPYQVELARAPAGMTSCPNSPALRRVSERALGWNRYAEVRFALWTECGLPTPPPGPTAAPPPACP